MQAANHTCNGARRIMLRERRTQGRVTEEARRNYNDRRRELRALISETKKKQWAELDTDPWGPAYRGIMRSIAAPAQNMGSDMLAAVTEHLFPIHKPVAYDDLDAAPLDEPPFTLRELRAAAARLKSGKTGGPDGIPVEAVKVAVNIAPHEVLACMNGCLTEKTFPGLWKRGKLVLIPKPGKNPPAPNAFRPLCLLDT